MVRKDISHKVAFAEVPKGSEVQCGCPGKNIPGRGNSVYKNPEPFNF